MTYPLPLLIDKNPEIKQIRDWLERPPKHILKQRQESDAFTKLNTMLHRKYTKNSRYGITMRDYMLFGRDFGEIKIDKDLQFVELSFAELILEPMDEEEKEIIKEMGFDEEPMRSDIIVDMLMVLNRGELVKEFYTTPEDFRDHMFGGSIHSMHLKAYDFVEPGLVNKINKYCGEEKKKRNRKCGRAFLT